ncbi:MAG: HNH endonuclease signature motif containing protein, partial [Candidatus Sericytochromatia bacterium]
RGCTRPGCNVPAYWCQVHHATKDWAQGGHTDIDDLTLACGPDNRLITDGGWRTRKRDDGTTEWIPPADRDHGQRRTNTYHHPERMRKDADGEDDPH